MIDFTSNVRPESMERITNFDLANAFIEEAVAAVRAQVGDKKVLLALSGGVDSSVVAALLIKAIGRQLTCVHVNHGLMRKGESEQVVEIFGKEMDCNLVYVDATDRFLDLLAGVSDPESKRKIIGAEFINVFADEARKLEGVEFLAQGTIYPDILESIKAAEGKKAVKSHHNVGGLPDDVEFTLVEPLRLLFKAGISAQTIFSFPESPSAYPVILLPSAARMTAQEQCAMNAYIQNGGRVIVTGPSAAAGCESGYVLPTCPEIDNPSEFFGSIANHMPIYRI